MNNLIIKLKEVKVKIAKGTVSIIKSWAFLFLLWAALGTRMIRNWFCIANDIGIILDFGIALFRAFISAMLFLIPLLQTINAIRNVKKNDEKEEIQNVDYFAYGILFTLSTVIIYVGRRDVVISIYAIMICWITNYILRNVFGKEVWSKTGGLMTFVAILFLNLTIFLSLLFLSYNPIKLLVSIFINILLIFTFNKINIKYKKINEESSPIVFVILLSFMLVSMTVLLCSKGLDNLYFTKIATHIKKLDKFVNLMFLYFLYYISSYYLLSRYSAIEFFLFYNAYDNNRNYYYKKMNDLFNFIVLIILLVGFHLFKIETLETIASFKHIVEFIRNHKYVFDCFSSSFVDAIGIVLIFITYIEIRKESNKPLTKEMVDNNVAGK